MILQYLVNGVVAGAAYSLIALGFALIYTATRVFHFGHGGAYVFAAFVGYTALTTLSLGLVGAFVFAALAGAILGVGTNRLLYEPMQRAGVSHFVMMISSFGVLIILTYVTAIIWGTNPVVLRDGSLVRVFRFGPIYITATQLQILAIALVLAIALSAFFKRMRLGIAIRALGNDPELAEIMGMPARRLRDASLAVGSALAGISGLLVGFNVGIIDFNMGHEAILMATVAIIIGGLGNLPAAAAGGLVLGIIQHLAIWQVSSKWQISISFGVLILMLLVRPQGLFGERRRVV
jgi:branched-subunit amino acid ABC-type transport system permease component